jgi:hypothetical protein
MDQIRDVGEGVEAIPGRNDCSLDNAVGGISSMVQSSYGNRIVALGDWTAVSFTVPRVLANGGLFKTTTSLTIRINIAYRSQNQYALELP